MDSGRPDLAGYDGGKADAEFALRQATDILGTPLLAPCIRFAADYDPAGHPERTDGYYDGVAAVMRQGFELRGGFIGIRKSVLNGGGVPPIPALAHGRSCATPLRKFRPRA